MDDFFVGYNWPVPQSASRFVRRVAVCAAAGAVGMAYALAAGHVRLAGGAFEYGHVHAVSGVVIEHPHPMLRLPGGDRWPLLVARGKHGADELVRGLDGQRVTLDVTRIARGREVMLEIAGGVTPSTRAGLTRYPADDTTAPGQRVSVSGEIVDTKCFLGVMVPGSGTTHRDCASLCLRGGIPPAILTHSVDGDSPLMLLAGREPELRRRTAELAGDLVEATGTIQRRGGWRVLLTNPAGWRRLQP
jgi:hypothetical protein